MSLFLTTSSECQAGAGYAHLTAISGGSGSYTYVLVRASDGATPYSGSITAAQLAADRLDFDGLYDDDYTLTVTDANTGETGTASFPLVCGYPNPGGGGSGGGGGGGGTNPPPSTVYGCTDAEADNYDPAATDDNGSCTYAPRLSADELPELAPLGVPLWVSIGATGIIGATPAPATLTLNLAGLGALAGVQVRVNGYLFTSGPLIVPGRFQDAASLRVAMQAWPALAAAYTFVLAGELLTLTATVPGLPGTPTATTSNPAAVVLALTPGVAALYSQKRQQWGCYVEVWAGCGSEFGGVVDKSTAVLAQRVVLPYRADNVYQVDVSPALSGFTGHAYPNGAGSCPDRLISYFVRFGELYADSATGQPTVRNAYETGVAWGLEAMVVPELISGVYLLSSRPSPWRVVSGRRAVLGLLTKQADPLALLLRYRLATSRTTTDVTLTLAEHPQKVRAYVSAWQLPEGLLSGELLPADDNGTVGGALASLEAQADGVGLTFVNREGCAETFFFAGNNEENDKRTASTYTNTAGPVNLSAEFQAGTKLYSGLLDFPTWDWLRQQLGTTPTVWLETQAGPLPVLLADVATESDVQKGEYSLAVTLNPPPVRGLRN